MNAMGRIICLTVCLSVMYGPALAGESIRIGATVSASGHFASEVGPFKKLFEAWAARVNASGGILLKKSGRTLPVEVVVYDDQSEVPVVTRYYERLAEKERVDLLVGPYSSPLTFAASLAAERNRIPFVAVCANSPKIYDRGFKWLAGVIDLAPRYTYRYWEMVAAEKKARSVAFVVEDTMHPRGVYDGSRRLAEQAGLTVSMAEIVPPGTQEFGGLIARLKDAGSDIVYVSANIPLAISFMKQVREKGLPAGEFHCIHHSGVFRAALGRGAEGVVGQSYWTPGMGLAGEDAFLAIIEAGGIDADSYPWAPAYMSAFQMIEQALAAAGSTEPEAVMAALRGETFATLCGPNRVHESGYGQINTFPSQIQDGRYQIIWPPDKATAPHRWGR